MGFGGRLWKHTVASKLWGGLKGESSGNYRKGLAGIINQARESNQLYGAQAREQLQKGLGAQLGGYDQAINKTSGIERTARRDAITRSGDLEASVTNQYGQGGRFGTTALDNARMGLHSSLTRDLDAIDSNFAGLFSQLSIGKGQAEAGGRSALAGLEIGQGDRESQLIQLLSGTLKKPKPGMLSELLGLAGAGLGTAFGGQFGGAIGGEAGSILGGSFENT
jgi:hypothetical protein